MTTKSLDPANVYNLPELCYVHVIGEPIGRHISVVKRGEVGHYPSPGMTMEAADRKNKTMEVSHAQRDAMKSGSMFGWHIAATNPALHTKAGPICDDTRQVEIEREAITSGNYVR